MVAVIVAPGDLRSGTATWPAQVYLDANFLVTAHFGVLETPYLLTEFQARSISLYISSLALDEAWWALLREWVSRDRGTRLTRSYLKDHPDLLSHYHPELKQFTDEIFNWTNAVFVATPEPRADSESVRAFILGSLERLNSEQLAPRDAFHLSILQGHSLSAIVTEDKDFDSIDSLTIYRFR